MKFAYYPGCSLKGTAIEYNISTLAMAKALGIDLIEIPDWICCGATSAHSTDAELALTLPLQTILNSQKIPGNLAISVSCAACYNRLRATNYKMRENAPFTEESRKVFDSDYKGEIKVYHLLDIIANQFGLEKLANMVTRQLKGLKVACYYGCLLTRPPEYAAFDDIEQPHIMDDIVKAVGAEPVDWQGKTDCCSASLALTRLDITEVLVNNLLDLASDYEPDCFLVACPLCHSNLDLRQTDVNSRFNTNYNIPVLYFTQLIGLAMGIPAKELAIQKHLTNAMPLVESKGFLNP